MGQGRYGRRFVILINNTCIPPCRVGLLIGDLEISPAPRPISVPQGLKHMMCRVNPHFVDYYLSMTLFREWVS